MKLFKILAPIVLSLGAAFPAMAQGELTCWYNEAGQGTGADSGNYANAPLHESVRNTAGGGGGAWVYVFAAGEWNDGNSCPPSINVSGAVGRAALGTMPNPGLTPTYGTVDLTAGFTPDPYQVNLYAGGTVAAGEIPECYAGWIAEEPDFRLNFTATTNPQLTISVTSLSDTTLVINDPNGNWVCNDDTNARDPAVVFSSPVSGQYNIWIGTFGGPRNYPPATLSVTEY